MKMILAMFIGIVTSVFSQDAPKRFDRLETTKGKVYDKVEVRKVEPDGLSIIHESGTTKISFEHLSDEMKTAFGYDQEKAKAHKAAKWQSLPKDSRFSVSPKSGIGCKIEYIDQASLVEKVKLAAKTEMLDDKYLQIRLKSVPLGGEVWFTINRSTIGAANTEYFMAIVTDESGKEIAREAGRDEIAEVPIGDGMWWNMFHVRIPVEIKSHINVRLVDRLDDKSANFVIRKLMPE